MLYTARLGYVIRQYLFLQEDEEALIANFFVTPAIKKGWGG